MACYFFMIAAGALGPLAVWAWNHMPAVWLCDYDERETERHGSHSRRLAAVPWAGLFAAGFVICGLCFVMRYEDLQWEWICSLVALWFLLLIALADLRYMVIPDQFVCGLVLLSLLTSRKALPGAILSGVACAATFFFMGKTACVLLMVWDRILSKKDKKYSKEHFKDCGSSACGDCDACGASQGFGMGDIKLLFALGLLLGLVDSFLAMLAASLLCGAIQAVNVLFGRVGMKEEKPFGPYLCLCAAALLLK